MEEDTTPKASPVVAFPQAQTVESGSINSSVPAHSLGTSMHALGNEMVDDSTPNTAPTPAADETFCNAMNVFFVTLASRLQPLIDKVDHLTNVVDGRTRPKNATTSFPPPHSSIPILPTGTTKEHTVKQTPYPKPTSGGGDSGGRKGSSQGEDNDSERARKHVRKFRGAERGIVLGRRL